MQPFISIVIPTYARPAPLTACLTALTRLDYPNDRFEVILVDDGSPSPLDELVDPFREKITVTLLRQERSGPAAARNLGVQNARGDYVAFTDDDCSPMPSWLKAMANVFADHPNAAVGGKTINALKDNPYSAASQLLIDYLYEYYNLTERSGRFFTSNNLAFPTQAFRTIGGFNRSFPLAAGEDRELCDRWLAQGNELGYAPEAVVEHYHLSDLRRYCDQHFNYGRGAYYFHHLKTKGTGWPLNSRALHFYGSLLTYPLKKRNRHNSWSMAALIAVSQIANAAGFFAECAKHPALDQHKT